MQDPLGERPIPSKVYWQVASLRNKLTKMVAYHLLSFLACWLAVYMLFLMWLPVTA